MTPAIKLAKKARVAFQVHEYAHDPSCESYGLEAAEKLGVAAQRIFKTLVVSLDGRTLVVAVVPVCAQLNMKLLAKAAGAKRAELAAAAQAERATGYVLGGVSPLGQKKRLKTYIDTSARDHPTVCVSAGRRGLEIELIPDDLAMLTDGVYAPLCQ